MTDRHLHRLVRGLASRRDVKHAIMAVERGDGSFRWRGAVGKANPHGTPLREDTPFFVASVTKLYIATVILKLYEGGVVRLDESIATYLPHTLTQGLHRLSGVDCGRGSLFGTC